MKNDNRDKAIELTDEQVENVSGGTIQLPEHSDPEFKSLLEPSNPEEQPCENEGTKFGKEEIEAILNFQKNPPYTHW